MQEAARSEADEDMGEAPTLENLQAEADGKQAAYAQQQKRQRREAAAAAASPGLAQGGCATDFQRRLCKRQNLSRL